ncbi:hypothetical protein HOA59_00965 [archaeon]|jgi:hypothetical protein|nr:hypothetical protein [archaeon]MBT6823989.1 hypothetical protein [archaeon]MBT7107222.1 hypothetical protein [archaeon]MBT7297143.1 hypothetical protein [archaeon]
MDISEFFQKPGTIREIIGDRNAEYVNLSEVVESFFENDSDKFYVVNDSIIPKNYKSSKHFSKRGPELSLKKPRSKAECLESKLTPNILWENAYDYIQSLDFNSGVVWNSFIDNNKRKLSLNNLIKGYQLFSFAENSDESCIKTIDYSGACGTHMVEVPSKSEEKDYSFRLENISNPNSDSKFSDWFNISFSNHDCKDNLYNIHGKRNYPDINFCPHVVAGLIKTAQIETKKQGSRVILPFDAPTEEFVSYWKFLQDSLLLESVEEGNRGLNSLRRSLLNSSETEICLHNFVAKRGYNNSFKSSGKNVQDYDCW